MQRVQRATVHYSGRVQGVGFRWRVRSIAEAHPVTGYVANLPDRRVLLVVEGERAAIKRFLDGVGARLRTHIAAAAEEWSEASGEFATFDIRRR